MKTLGEVKEPVTGDRQSMTPFMCEMSGIGKFVEAGSGLVMAQGWGGSADGQWLRGFFVVR